MHPARPFENAREIIDAARELDTRGVAMAVFPELCVSGYAIDDLFLQDVLLDNVEKALAQIVEASADLLPLLVVGAPLRKDNALYNCAVAIHRGRVLAIVPKSHLPNYREFYEKRHFVTMPPRASEAHRGAVGRHRRIQRRPRVGPLRPGPPVRRRRARPDDRHRSLRRHVGARHPVHGAGARGRDRPGEPVGLPHHRRDAAPTANSWCSSVSARCSAAYVYTAAGMGESSTDLAWDGEAMIYEAGDRLADRRALRQEGAHITIADVDLERLRTERKRQNSFTDNAQTLLRGRRAHDPAGGRVHARPAAQPTWAWSVAVNRFPFVPDDPTRLEQDCYEAYNIQVAGLAQRLRAIGNPKIVIGVSGGLDSTHALVVASRAMDLLGRPRTDILCYTLPGFATSERTKKNATLLCQ